MKTVDHPYLAGVKCRDDGAVWIPDGGRGCPAHWTFGAHEKKGYRVVTISRKHRKVHRLVCEAFHGLCPSDKCQVDHIDRNPSNNRPENLRWCTPAENTRNRAVYSQYGVSSVNNNAAYQRARYAKKKKSAG